MSTVYFVQSIMAFFNMPVILTSLYLFSALKVLWVEEILGSTGERSSQLFPQKVNIQQCVIIFLFRIQCCVHVFAATESSVNFDFSLFLELMLLPVSRDRVTNILTTVNFL